MVTKKALWHNSCVVPLSIILPAISIMWTYKHTIYIYMDRKRCLKSKGVNCMARPTLRLAHPCVGRAVPFPRPRHNGPARHDQVPEPCRAMPRPKAPWTSMIHPLGPDVTGPGRPGQWSQRDVEFSYGRPCGAWRLVPIYTSIEMWQKSHSHALMHYS